MSFASPIALLLLVPWGGLVLWLLSGLRDRVSVPFLDLWSGPVAAPRIKRTIQPPPAALALVLGSLFLGIFGMAAPGWRSSSTTSRVTLIVDRGITMSPAAQREKLYSLLPEIPAENVVLVPSSGSANWKDAPPSAIATSGLLQNAVARALADTTDAVVVLSDQKIDRQDSRILQISPDSAPQNVDIVRLAASISSKPQVMVRVRNQSSLKSCQLTVTSGDQSVTKSIDLSAFDGEADAFVDLPKLADMIEAKIDAVDDLAADNTAWLVRQRSWPRIEVRSDLPPELRRMIDVYQTHRPASESSRRVNAIADLFALPPNEPGVAILREGSNAKPTNGRVGVEFDEPVVANVDWREVVKDAVAAQSPGEGWRPVVSCGSQVLVAVRDATARQVWVGFNSPTFPKLKDYVIFWTNVFDYVGQGGDEFTSEPVQMVGSEWKLQTKFAMEPFDILPGIYRRGDGSLRALNATDVHFDPPIQTDWRRKLASVSKPQFAGFDLRPASLIGAMLLLLGASTLWKRQAHFDD
jgi:hypothetical protein